MTHAKALLTKSVVPALCFALASCASQPPEPMGPVNVYVSPKIDMGCKVRVFLQDSQNFKGEQIDHMYLRCVEGVMRDPITRNARKTFSLHHATFDRDPKTREVYSTGVYQTSNETGDVPFADDNDRCFVAMWMVQTIETKDPDFERVLTFDRVVDFTPYKAALKTNCPKP